MEIVTTEIERKLLKMKLSELEEKFKVSAKGLTKRELVAVIKQKIES